MQGCRHIVDLHTTSLQTMGGSYTGLKKEKEQNKKNNCSIPGIVFKSSIHYHRSEHWIVVKGTTKWLWKTMER